MGVAARQATLSMPATTPFQKELSAWIQRPRDSSELSPERLAEAMDSGQNLQLSCLSTEQNQHLQASLSRLHRVAQVTRGWPGSPLLMGPRWP